MPCEEFHTAFHLWEDGNRDLMLTDALEIHFLEMAKFRKIKEKDIKNDELHRWLVALDEKSPAKLLEEAVSMDATIQKMEEVMDFITRNQEEFRAFERIKFAASDLTSSLNYARSEGISQGISKGIEQGITQGISKGILQTARNFKRLGISFNEISQATGLSIEEIDRL